MRHCFLTFLILLLTAVSVEAMQPKRGYRGFAEWSNDYSGDAFYDTRGFGKFNGKLFYTGFATSHGYQFNPWLYTGGGFELMKSKKLTEARGIIFADVRTDLKFWKFTPFIDLRVGYIINEGEDLRLCPSIGYRINWGNKLGVNLALGYSIVGYEDYEAKKVFNPTHGGYVINYDIRHSTNSFLSFRVGVDF